MFSFESNSDLSGVSDIVPFPFVGIEHFTPNKELHNIKQVVELDRRGKIASVQIISIYIRLLKLLTL